MPTNRAAVKGNSAKRILASLQMVSMALLVGISLYIYNDWRVHRSSAAPLPQGASGQNTKGGGTVETPLDLGNQGVSGTVEVGPDGTIHPLDGGQDIPAPSPIPAATPDTSTP